MRIGKLNNRITITRPVVTEDDYGDLTLTSTDTVATIWGKVMEMPSEWIIENGKTREERTIKVMCRTQSIVGIEIDDELTFSKSDDTWKITRVYNDDSGFETGTTTFAVIEAEYKI